MILHVDYFISSMDKSLEFYVDKLGMEIIEDSIVSGELVKFVSNGVFDAYRLVLLKESSQGAMIELMQYIDQSCESCYKINPHSGSITILVNELEKKMENLKSKGIFPASDVFFVSLANIGNAKIIFYKDPDGYLIEFLQMIP